MKVTYCAIVICTVLALVIWTVLEIAAGVLDSTADRTTVMSSTPRVTSAPSASVPVSEYWWGWNPESIDKPPLLPEWPWYDNTGLWRAEDREALRLHEGDFQTSTDGEVIDRINITGDLIVRNENVTVKRSWLHGGVQNETDSPVRIIYCDIGDGRVGDYKSNGNKGVVHVFRSNLFGLTDAFQTTASSGSFVVQDNFVHDLRYATDPSVPSGGGHNDGVKAESKFPTTILIRHNTFWSWTMNNMTEQETATRSSGPNWTDNGDPLTSTGNTARDGKPENGLQNSGVMIAPNQPMLKAYIDNNLFRGHVYFYVNVQGGYVEVTNNKFATDEQVADRAIIAGRKNISVWSKNTEYQSGEQLAGNEKE